MIEPRCTSAAPPVNTITPPIEVCANVVKARSISDGSAHSDGAQLHAERGRHRLNRAQQTHRGGIDWIPKDTHAGQAWRKLFEQFDPFRADAEFEQGKSGHVAARPR